MTDETTAANAQNAQSAPAPPESVPKGAAPMTATELASNAGSPQNLAAAGQSSAQDAVGSSATGSSGAGDQVGATSGTSAQALEEAWRERLVNDIVTRVQQMALAAAPPAASAPPVTPKPSPSRIVIFRDGTGNEYPAIITRVYPTTGAVALFVFRDDAAGFSPGGQVQIDPASEGKIGWYWPPRT